MARVKCVMMQKDETLVLDAWFRYYGYLFGLQNLTVFDNGSTDPGVIATLRHYEAAGSTIIWDHKSTEDFHAKGSHFRNVVFQWDWAGGYDFAIPVDCDEFLALITDDEILCNKEKIHEHFDSLIGEKRALGFGLCFYNVPSMKGLFWPDLYPKSFLAEGTVGEIDHGFHAISSAKQAGRRSTDFTYIHMHNKPFDLLQAHARRKLTLFVDVEDKNALSKYRGPGLHLIKYFFISEEQYKRSFDEKLLVSIPSFSWLVSELQINQEMFGNSRNSAHSRENASTELSFPAAKIGQARVTAKFDAAIYRRLHADVSASDWKALEHYLLAGYGEGRSLHPKSANR